MKQTVLSVTVLALIISGSFIAGCQEENLSPQDKQIKMLKNDKLELTKQIQTLKEQIKDQQRLIEQLKNDSLQQEERQADSQTKLMKLFAESEAKVQALTEEIEQLKKQLGQ